MRCRKIVEPVAVGGNPRLLSPVFSAHRTLVNNWGTPRHGEFAGVSLNCKRDEVPIVDSHLCTSYTFRFATIKAGTQESGVLRATTTRLSGFGHETLDELPIPPTRRIHTQQSGSHAYGSRADT